MEEIEYSIVIPIYNEGRTLPELKNRVIRTMEAGDSSFELIFVDDCSNDSSFKIMRQFNREDSRIKIVALSRNFGHQAAIMAGLDHAVGNAIIMMDGDLQDPPEVLPKLIQKYHDGFDVVYAIRASRKENVFKRSLFKLFYRLLNILSSNPQPVDAGTFSIMDKKVLYHLKNMPEHNKYLSGLRSWVGFKQTGIPFERDKRFSGKPRQTAKKLLKLAFDGIFSFSYVPLRIVTILGVAVSFFAFIGVLIVFYKKFISYTAIPGWASLLISVLVMGGIQLFAIGLLGEYIARIYDEVKERPYYIIKEKIGFS